MMPDHEDCLDLLVQGGLAYVDGSLVARDVGVRDGRIAAVVAPGTAGDARDRVDATGRLVLPGLIDMHTHVNWANGRLGITPDKLAARSGVTTWVDAGSTGAGGFEGLLRHVADRSRIGIVPFLNFSYLGLATAGMMTREVGELWDASFGDLRAVLRTAEEHPGAVRGIKVRASANTIGDNTGVILPQAREAADLLAVPLMVHVGMAPPVVDEVLPFLRAGDLLTHCYHPHPGGRILDAAGRVRDSVRDAVQRGVLLDVGHGNASISHDVARRALDQGYAPATISSDLHSEKAPSMLSLLTVVEMFLAFGMTVEEALARVTSAPADALARPDLGRIAEGAPADLAIVSLEESDVVKLDSTGDALPLRTAIVHHRTYKDGVVLEAVADDRVEFRDSPWATKFLRPAEDADDRHGTNPDERTPPWG